MALFNDMNGRRKNSVGCEWKSQRPVADFNDGYGGYTTEPRVHVRKRVMLPAIESLDQRIF